MGQHTAMLSTIRDITERKQAEQELRAREEQTRVILDRALDTVTSIDSHSVITGWNPQAETIFGWLRQEALGQFIYDLIIPPRYRAAHQRSLAHFLITEHKQALETTAYLAAIVQASGDAILGISLDGLIQSWNPAAERLFGYAAAEAIGQSHHLLAPADHYPEQDEMLARLRAGESLRRETVRRTKTGQPVDVLVTRAPLLNAAGQVIGISATFTDMTLRKQAHLAEMRQQIIQAQEAERQRMAREIHDGPVQELAALGFALDFLAARLTAPASQVELATFRLSDSNLTAPRSVPHVYPVQILIP